MKAEIKRNSDKSEHSKSAKVHFRNCSEITSSFDNTLPLGPLGESGSRARRGPGEGSHTMPSPAATASDPPRGRVILRVVSFKQRSYFRTNPTPLCGFVDR